MDMLSGLFTVGHLRHMSIIASSQREFEVPKRHAVISKLDK